MTPRFARQSGALVALLAATLSSPAAAGPGNGIRLGGSEGRLHPYLELETRYDSNALYQENAAKAGYVLHLRPGLVLTSPGDKLAIDLDANLDWNKWLSPSNSDLDKLFAKSALGIGVNRRGSVGFELKDDFERSASTSSLTFGSAVVSNRNVLQLSLPWRPGGGALAVTPLGTWKLESFEPYSSCDPAQPPDASCDAERLKALGYNEYTGGAEVKWRFLPRTAAVVDGGWTQRVPNDTAESPNVGGWRARGGVQGLVTPHLAATLKGGWGSADATGVGSVSTWLAVAELEWLPSLTTSARVGYVHDWGSDPGAPYALYRIHRAYVDGKMLLASRVTVALLGQYEQLDYTVFPGSSTIVHLEPTVDYGFARWLSAGLGYAYSRRNVSGFDTSFPNFPTQLAYDYTKNEIWLRVRGTY